MVVSDVQIDSLDYNIAVISVQSYIWNIEGWNIHRIEYYYGIYLDGMPVINLLIGLHKIELTTNK